MSTKNKKKSNPDIKFGDINLPEDIFESKNVKCRITTLIDQDILTEIKKRASSENVGYQTKINQFLRDYLFNMTSIEKRLKRIEQKLFKNQHYQQESI
ncbi:MAG: hypothetical protein HQM16_07725 [Deltaproteobacteria bacterium]|nr:hypothetical protein [Deltaproteobacteria bacterium]